jgi:hypothetical protein
MVGDGWVNKKVGRGTGKKAAEHLSRELEFGIYQQYKR